MSHRIPLTDNIPAEAYSGLPFRVESPCPATLFSEWDNFKAAGFDVRDMRPRADFDGGAMGMPVQRNGFTAQRRPDLKSAPPACGPCQTAS